MTLLVCSIPISNEAGLRDDVARTRRGGADAVELRLDGLEGDPSWIASLLAENVGFEFILACRSRAEGGLSDDRPAARMERIRRAAGDNDVCIDFEWADWQASGGGGGGDWPASGTSPSGQAGARRVQDGRLPRLILSSHRFDGVPPDAVAWVKQVHASCPRAVAKIAWQPRDIRDNIVAAAAMEAGAAVDASSPGRVGRGRACAICLGDDGIISRVLAPRWGAYATYCALDASRRTAPGQLTLEEMVGLYRFNSITPDTAVCGVIGDPVAHSMGPVLFNALFERHGVDAVYLPWRVPASELRTYLDAFRSAGRFNLRAFSVTLPHKVDACRLAGGYGDSFAGAANTLTAAEGGRWRGRNTDTAGASAALRTAVSLNELRLARIDVLGAGGTGRALANWFPISGCHVALYARNPSKCEGVVHHGCTVKPWEDRLQSAGGILINATPVGMWPKVDETPMPKESLSRYSVVLDTVYHPPQTRLLREAKAAGCRTISGVEMFIHQAAFQFIEWTGLNPDVDEMRRIVLAELERRQAQNDAAGQP